MKTVTLTAHYDGERIQLDEPFALSTDARLLVTILPEPVADTERQDWYAFSKAGLARAYSDDEPDYPARCTMPLSFISRECVSQESGFQKPVW